MQDQTFPCRDFLLRAGGVGSKGLPPRQQLLGRDCQKTFKKKKGPEPLPEDVCSERSSLSASKRRGGRKHYIPPGTGQLKIHSPANLSTSLVTDLESSGLPSKGLLQSKRLGSGSKGHPGTPGSGRTYRPLRPRAQHRLRSILLHSPRRRGGLWTNPRRKLPATAYTLPPRTGVNAARRFQTNRSISNDTFCS